VSSSDSENDIDKHFCEAVSAAGGVTKKIIGRGWKGCADHLTAFSFNRLFLVELKRPRGGRIKFHQDEDAREWYQMGVVKVYLRNTDEINAWIAKVRA
jgi:hypothetical protein